MNGWGKCPDGFEVVGLHLTRCPALGEIGRRQFSIVDDSVLARFLKACQMKITRNVRWIPVAVFVSTLFTSAVLAQQPVPLEGHTDPVYDAVFTPDGKWVITASFDKTLRLFDRQSRQSVRTMSGHTALVLSIAVHPDGDRIASGGMDNTIKIWDVPNNSPTASHGVCGRSTFKARWHHLHRRSNTCRAGKERRFTINSRMDWDRWDH